MSDTDHTSDPMSDALRRTDFYDRGAAERRVLTAEVAARSYRERAEKAERERDALAARIERARALADVLDSEGRETAALGGVYRQGLGDSACDAAARIRAALDGGE